MNNSRVNEQNEAGRIRLARRLVETIQERETELARISSVLHDQVSQVLSAIGLQLDVMRLDFRDQAAGIEERTAEIQNMLERVINQLRDLSFELNPSVVERAGLHPALDRLAGRVRNSSAGVFHLYFDSSLKIPGPVAGVFYKIAETVIEGCILRSDCSEIDVQVKRAQSRFVLEIRDNSDPSKASAEERSFMELMLEQYASQSGVALKVKYLRPTGTLIQASFPESASVPSPLGEQ